MRELSSQGWLSLLIGLVVIGAIGDSLLLYIIYDVQDIRIDGLHGFMALFWLVVASVVVGAVYILRGKQNYFKAVAIAAATGSMTIGILGDAYNVYFSNLVSSWKPVLIFDVAVVIAFSAYLMRVLSIGSRPKTEPVIKVGHSPNEPLRLLLSSIVLGRTPWIRQALSELEIPFCAQPPELSVDISLAKHAFKECDDRAFGYQVIYSMIFGLAYFVGLTDPPLALALFLVASSGLYALQIHQEKYRLAPPFHSRIFLSATETTAPHVSLDNRHSAKFRSVSVPDVIVYRGYNPFDNFGWEFGNWVLTADITRPCRSEMGGTTHSLASISLADAKDKIAESLHATDSVNSLSIRELAFVQGANIPEALKPEPIMAPRQSLSRDDINLLEQEMCERVRSYSWINASEWDQELELSYFLRLHVKNDTFFMDLHGVIMPPVSADLRFIDTIPERRLSNVVADLVVGLYMGSMSSIFSPLLLAARFLEALGSFLGSKEQRTRKAVINEIRSNPMYDFGAPRSLRRRAAGSDYEHYFQMVDRRLYEQSIRGAIIRGFIDYLDDCAVDTSELREQRNTILNQGIIVQKGDLKAQNVAVGQGAKVTQSAGK